MSSTIATSVKRQDVTLQCCLMMLLSRSEHTSLKVDGRGSFSVNILDWKVMAKNAN